MLFVGVEIITDMMLTGYDFLLLTTIFGSEAEW